MGYTSIVPIKKASRVIRYLSVLSKCFQIGSLSEKVLFFISLLTILQVSDSLSEGIPSRWIKSPTIQLFKKPIIPMV